MLKYTIIKDVNDMKITNFILILTGFICFQSAVICNTSAIQNANGKIYWQGSSPDSVAAKANQTPSFSSSNYPGAIQEGGLSPDIGGMINSMMPGINNTPYALQEQRKQQIDYVKQQVSE